MLHAHLARGPSGRRLRHPGRVDPRGPWRGLRLPSRRGGLARPPGHQEVTDRLHIQRNQALDRGLGGRQCTAGRSSDHHRQASARQKENERVLKGSLWCLPGHDDELPTLPAV